MYSCNSSDKCSTCRDARGHFFCFMGEKFKNRLNPLLIPPFFLIFAILTKYKGKHKIIKIMANDNKGLTPMMRQFFEMKSKHPEALLLFRCGDFYETYCEDAVEASRILGITHQGRKASCRM